MAYKMFQNKLEYKTKKFELEIFYKSGFVDVKKIIVDKNGFSEMCKDGCGIYNSCWACPPYSPSFLNIKNGFEIIQTFNLADLKKLSYGIISQTEYQHRIPQEQLISAKIIGDKEGAHINYRDITLEEFIASQIQTRVLLKFGKPEVEINADIDKEVLKIVAYTLKIYEFKDFNFVELTNLANGAKFILNQKAVLADSRE